MITQNDGIGVKYFEEESHLKHTCDIIYQHHRRRKLEKKYLNLILFLISIVLSIGTILVISLVNYDEVFAVKNDRLDYLNTTHSLCDNITYGVIDLISTPLAALILIFYIILYKRRVLLRNKFKYRNVGLPMIVTNWNKWNKFYTSMVYGLMALNIFEIVSSTISKSGRAYLDIKKVNDGNTSIVKLLFTIAQVILVGISKTFAYII
jgi:hypothetical protein